MRLNISDIEAEVEVKTLLDGYHDAERFMALCRECPSYGTVWGCPPFDFDVNVLLAEFSTARLFATRIDFADDIKRECSSPDECSTIIREALDEAWLTLLPRLYKLERDNAGSRVFTSRCRLCGDVPCGRSTGVPCRHSDRLRNSLESVGFNVDAIARDILHTPLKWSSTNVLPEYLTLVTALFLK